MFNIIHFIIVSKQLKGRQIDTGTTGIKQGLQARRSACGGPWCR